MCRSREAIRLHDIARASEEASSVALILVAALVVIPARSEFRGGCSPVLFAHALADAQAVHELRPPLEDGLVALFLLLLRRDVLCLPVRLYRTISGTKTKRSVVLTSRTVSSFSAATTTPEITGNALPFRNSKPVWQHTATHTAHTNVVGGVDSDVRLPWVY